MESNEDNRNSFLFLLPEDFLCSACMDPFHSLDMVNRLPCGHTIHIYCMFMVQSRNCPLCRVSYERQLIQFFKRCDDFVERRAAAAPVTNEVQPGNLQTELDAIFLNFAEEAEFTTPSPPRTRRRRNRRRTRRHEESDFDTDTDDFVLQQHRPRLRRQNAYLRR